MFWFKSNIKYDVVRAVFDVRRRNVPSPPNHGHATGVIGLGRNPNKSETVQSRSGTYFRDPRVPKLTLSLRGYTSFAHQQESVSCKAIQPDSIPISAPPSTYLVYIIFIPLNHSRNPFQVRNRYWLRVADVDWQRMWLTSGNQYEKKEKRYFKSGQIGLVCGLGVRG